MTGNQRLVFLDGGSICSHRSIQDAVAQSMSIGVHRWLTHSSVFHEANDAQPPGGHVAGALPAAVLDSWLQMAWALPPGRDVAYQIGFGDGRIWWGWNATNAPTGGWAGQTNRFGLRYNRYSDGSGNLSVPTWYLAPPLLLAALVCMRAAGRRADRLAGICLTCGYDLRATPDRCPECGTVPAKHEVVSRPRS